MDLDGITLKEDVKKSQEFGVSEMKLENTKFEMSKNGKVINFVKLTLF